MSTIRRLDVRGFLEGVEIPVVSAVIQIVPDAPAMCTVQVVATDAILYLKDRTILHLVFKDLLETDYDTDLNKYKLGYTGEVRGIQMSKRVASRSAFLQCEDFSAYWDQCFQYIQNFSSGGDAFWDRTSSFIGANKGLFDNILRSPEVVIANLINGTSATRPESKGLIAGVLRLFERMGGVYSGKHIFRGQNDFFSAAELRCRITDQIGAANRDTTSAKMMQQKAFINWITNTMGSYGSLLSYRDILKILFQFIFHESCPNPMPLYQSSGTRTYTQYEDIPMKDVWGNTKLARRYYAILEEIRVFTASESGAAKGIQASRRGRSAGKPRTDEGANIQAFIESIRTLITREINVSGADAFNKARHQYGSGLVEQPTKWLEKLRDGLLEGLKPLNRALTAAEQYQPDVMIRELNNALRDMDKLSPIPTRRVAKQKTVATRDLLYTQLIYPNLYFAPPPRCNVIFPEHYIDFQFARDFRKEITRMRIQLKYWLEGRGSTSGFGRAQMPTSLLGIYYYAPDILGHKEKLYLHSTNNFARVLLPHERFSGIIPSIQSLGRVNFYLARKDENYRKSGGGIPYVQRTANFKFFHDRYSARQLTVVGVFNENLVCGLPALVLDRYGKATMDVPYNREELRLHPGKRPTQYLGRIMQLVHTLSQDNPTTTAVLGTVRTHDERVELIGAGEKEKLRKSKVDKDRVKKMSQIKSDAESLGSSLLKLKDDAAAGQVHAQLKKRFRSAADHADEIRMMAEQVRIMQAGRIMIRVNTAVLEAERLLVSGNTLQAIAHLNHAITMTKTVSSFVPAEIKLDPEQVPAEEVLRPPWYDPLYDNNRIGKDFYQPLLGCDSLVDMVAVKQEGSALEYPTLTASTVQFAVDQLVEAYGSIKRSGGNVVSFVRSFTHRPIATLAQVMGDKGFHRHSFGSYTAFEDFQEDPLLGVENASTTIRKLDPSMDVRAERREVVLRYVQELEDRVLLG